MPASLPPSDALGEALGFLRLTETAYYHSELAAPWGLLMPENCPKFHFVLTGECWLQTDGAADRRLEPGDFVVIPHGKCHRLASAPSAPTLDFSQLTCERVSARYAVFRRKAAGPVTTILCGDVNFLHPAAAHLVSLLPRVMHIRASANESLDWLRGTMRFLAAEARELRPGGEAIITRLADILVIQALRFWIEQTPPELTGWLAALRDEQIARALGLVHREPQKAWTVASLASAVAMSRSAFAGKFSRLVGEPALQYLTRWRMHLAQVYLRDGTKNLDEIAALLGYQSGAAFSRAFKRARGIWPGALKRSGEDATRVDELAHQFLKEQLVPARAVVA